MNLLEDLCAIHSPSGNEGAISHFLLAHVEKEKKDWNTPPKIFSGKGFQDCVVLVFGKPRTAVFAHIDTVGFTVGYNNGLIPIGSPSVEDGQALTGSDSKGPIEASLRVEKKSETFRLDFEREVDRGTDLCFKAEFREAGDFIQTPYLDNRLGVWNALQIARTLEDGILCFSCWEEHGGGSVGFLSRLIFEDFGVDQALIGDVTWVTEGVKAGEGVAISHRDRSVPRRNFIDRIREIAASSDIPHQLEAEGSGGSDGAEIQRSPYPIDWCFVGPPTFDSHTPHERVHKSDIESTVKLYKLLMKEL